MKLDEFNIEKITNEGENPNFEFGNTQDNESTFYFENDDQLRDEINDNPSSNDENKSPEKKEKRRKEDRKEKEESNKSSNKSSGSSGSSASGAGSLAATGAAVVAAVCVVTGIVSVGAGPFTPEVDKVVLTPHETSIKCDFDIFNDDSLIKYKVELYNDGIEQHFEKESQIGHNELEFTDLASSTEYTFEIFRGNPNEQQEYSYQSIYSENVTTLDIPVPPTPPTPSEFITLSFDADNRGGTMSSLELETGSEYSLPVCIFVPFDDEYFGGWKVNGEGEMLQPGETITVNSDTTLVAGWTKFPTKDNTVTANRAFFSYFPEQPSTDISSVTLMNIEFQYSNVAYSSNEETLDMYVYDGFISTTTPFAGPIKSITVNSKTVDYDLTMVFSESPIYERVTEGGETQRVEFAQDYTFECTNPDARYFCLSRDNAGSSLASFNYIKFVYETPLIENEFHVYFDANGGIGSCDPYIVRNTNKQTIPPIQRIGTIFPQDGYKFSGWKIEGVEDLLTPGTEVGISSDVTLVAQWEPTDLLTVRLDANGGSFNPIYPNQVQMNEIVTLPGEDELSGLLPPEEGYVFDGWSETPDGSSPVSYDYQVTKNVTLYIRWQQTGSYSLGSCLYLFTAGDTTVANDTTVQVADGYISMRFKGWKYNSGESDFNVSDGGFLANNTATPGEIISVTIKLSKSITLSVAFSQSKMTSREYDPNNIHQYTCIDGDESYEFFSSLEGCTYYNISAEENSDYTIVKDIIVKYKIS